LTSSNFYIGSQHRGGKPLLEKLPPLAAPLLENHSTLPPLFSGSPNMKDIRFITAFPFAKLSQNPNYQVFKFTWKKLDGIKKSRI
jgi:hypothetical protein